jgi:hypothetical protein
LATSVKYELPVGNIEKIGVRITRRTNSGKQGELAIWQNEVGFKPSDHEYFFVVSWTELAQWIKDNEQGEEGKLRLLRMKNSLEDQRSDSAVGPFFPAKANALNLL